jgi:hypothetical protein
MVADRRETVRCISRQQPTGEGNLNSLGLMLIMKKEKKKWALNYSLVDPFPPMASV